MEAPRSGGSRVRRPPIVPLLVLLAIIGGLLFLVLARSSAEQQIRRLIDRQLKLAAAGRFGQLHATLTRKAKAACSRADLVSNLNGLSASEPDFWSLIDIRNIAIQVTGNRAVVTYAVTYNGRVVERATREAPDLYVRATATELGPKPDLEQALANLERQHSNIPGLGQQIGDRQYKAQKARLLKFGTERPLLYKKGQWYDDADSHVRCGT
ncbi:MAG: hypothetical protein ACRDHO_02010 [Actinomycetota bacterium]